MLKIYGSDLCKDCLECKAALDNAGVEYMYCSITESLVNMKQFLSIRENTPLFDNARASGYIGIPCIVLDDESVLLDWESLI